MNWLDIVLLIVLALSVFSGLKNGAIRTVLSFAGLVLGVLFAGRFYDRLAPYLTFIPEGTAANALAFVIILFGTMLVATILGALLTKVIAGILLGWLNHLLGGIFGFLIGVVVTGALLTIWLKWRGPTDIITGSGIASFLVNQFPVVLALLPADFDSVRQFFK